MAQYYADKKKLYDDLCEWKIRKDNAIQAGQKVPPLPDSVGIVILKIADHMATRPNFRGYTWIEQMKGAGIVQAVKAMNKFDPTVKGKSGEPNPFGYISLYMWRGFLNHIGYEKNIQQKKLKYMADPSNEFFDTIEGDDYDIDSASAADYIWEN